MTFTGIFRAKGNEAGMVYIVNAQDCHVGVEFGEYPQPSLYGDYQKQGLGSGIGVGAA